MKHWNDIAKLVREDVGNAMSIETIEALGAIELPAATVLIQVRIIVIPNRMPAGTGADQR